MDRGLPLLHCISYLRVGHVVDEMSQIMFFVSFDFFQQVDKVGVVLTDGLVALAKMKHLVYEDVLEIRVEPLLKLSEKHLKTGVIAGFRPQFIQLFIQKGARVDENSDMGVDVFTWAGALQVLEQFFLVFGELQASLTGGEVDVCVHF